MGNFVMGRRKGSKNKSKGSLLAEAIETKSLLPDDNSKQGETISSPTLTDLFGNAKDIKKKIRKLKKVKLQCRAGTKERIALHRQIQELKAQLQSKKVGNDEKDAIIKEIKSLEPSYYQSLEIDLYKFTVKQLQYHLKKLKDGVYGNI